MIREVQGYVRDDLRRASECPVGAFTALYIGLRVFEALSKNLNFKGTLDRILNQHLTPLPKFLLNLVCVLECMREIQKLKLLLSVSLQHALCIGKFCPGELCKSTLI